jgi:hypothetical protein
MVRLKSDLVDLVEHGVNGTLDAARRSGTGARRSVSCSRRAAIPTIRCRAT